MKPKRAVILANGQITEIERLRNLIQPGDIMIAADGGFRYFNLLKIIPQILIGDLDSVQSSQIEIARKTGVEIQKHPANKDQTDLQLALDYAISMDCEQIIIAGALGGRLDHTLANIFLLTRSDLIEKDVRLDDGTEEVFLIRSSAEITGQAGDRVSLIPYGRQAVDVMTENLKFPLRSETLNPNETRGVSNEMLSENARVSLSNGILICTHSRQ